MNKHLPLVELLFAAVTLNDFIKAPLVPGAVAADKKEAFLMLRAEVRAAAQKFLAADDTDAAMLADEIMKFTAPDSIQ